MEKEMEELTIHSDKQEPPKAEEKKTENKVQVDKSSDLDAKNDGKTAIARLDSIPEDDWQSYCKLGHSVAGFILDAFEGYGSDQFVELDKSKVQVIQSALNQVKGDDAKGRNRVCEYILIEKMKEKEFFCCNFCMQAFFNYKQALIHFVSSEHRDKEIEELDNSCIVDIRRVLNSFTKLPAKWAEEDTKTENNRRLKSAKAKCQQLRPDDNFFAKWAKQCEDRIGVQYEKNCMEAHLHPIDNLPFTTDVFLTVAKSEFGQKMMAELHEHLDKAQTECYYCGYQTGDRDGYYAHYISSSHLKGLANHHRDSGGPGFDAFTTVINVHRKDLI